MGTDTLRKWKKKIDNFLYFYIEDIKVSRWKRYVPKFIYIKNLNCFSIYLYDCSMLTRHVTKKHLLDYHVNMYPKWKWLSFVGITFWFPYTFEEIKNKVKDYFLQDDLKEFQEINQKISDEIKSLKDEAAELVYCADTAAKLLRENGFHGKAEALEKRYLKLGKRLGIFPKRKPPTKPTEDKSI